MARPATASFIKWQGQLQEPDAAVVGIQDLELKTIDAHLLITFGQVTEPLSHNATDGVKVSFAELSLKKIVKIFDWR